MLLGHIDTVGTRDYGLLEPWALDPEALTARWRELPAMAPGVADDMALNPDDWLFGRGVADMKSGVAACIAVMRGFVQHRIPPPLSVVFIATPDEEYESAGVLQAIPLLLRLQHEHGLEYVGAINTDYVTSEYDGDPNWYFYAETAGKLLPSFYVVGRSSHAGDPTGGINASLLVAELARDLSLNGDLRDTVDDQTTPLPAVLHLADLKTGYDTQIPFTAWMYLNVLTFTTEPGALLERLAALSVQSLGNVLRGLDEARLGWTNNGAGARAEAHVITYAQLHAGVVDLLGEERVRAELMDEWDRLPADLDKREHGLHLVQRLWSVSGLHGPAVVLFYSPPYYPHGTPRPSELRTAVAAVADEHPELNLVERQYFPLLSDMSYLRFAPSLIDLPAFTDNMPVWREWDTPARVGSYSLPLELMAELNLPVVNLGPYGRAAHECGERVRMSLAFGALPALIHETIERIGQSTE